MRGIPPPATSQLASPPFVGKTLMHFLAYAAASVCPEALKFGKDLSLLAIASNCDLNLLEKEVRSIEETRVKALEEVEKWEQEARGGFSTLKEKPKPTRSSRVQRGSVIFQGMANLIGQEPNTANEQEDLLVKDIVALKTSLQENEKSLKQVHDQIKEAIELGKECKVWFGDVAEAKEEEKEGEKEKDVSADLTDLKEWLQDVFGIIDSFQNACAENLIAYQKVARAAAQQENDLKQQLMRAKAKELQKSKEMQKEKKALAMALATAAAAKVKAPPKSTKRSILNNQTSSLRAKRNSIVQHATKRNSVLLHQPASAAKGPTVRSKRNSIVNLIKPAVSARNTSGGITAAMKSIRGSVAGLDGSDEESDEDDWDSD